MTIALYDTNVLISGLFWPGAPRQLIHLAVTGLVQVVTCQALLDELKSVLIRPGKSFRLTEQEATRVINDVLTYVRLVTLMSEVTVCRDVDDNIVLACALDGRANYVVTGDPDLLVLGEFQGIKIVTAREFLEALNA